MRNRKSLFHLSSTCRPHLLRPLRPRPKKTIHPSISSHPIPSLVAAAIRCSSHARNPVSHAPAKHTSSSYSSVTTYIRITESASPLPPPPPRSCCPPLIARPATTIRSTYCLYSTVTHLLHHLQPPCTGLRSPIHTVLTCLTLFRPVQVVHLGLRLPVARKTNTIPSPPTCGLAFSKSLQSLPLGASLRGATRPPASRLTFPVDETRHLSATRLTPDRTSRGGRLCLQYNTFAPTSCCLRYKESVMHWASDRHDSTIRPRHAIAHHVTNMSLRGCQQYRSATTCPELSFLRVTSLL